jgi:hypothetical protein
VTGPKAAAEIRKLEVLLADERKKCWSQVFLLTKS